MYLLGASIGAILIVGFMAYVWRNSDNAWNGIVIVLGFGVLVYQLDRTFGFPFTLLFGVGMLAVVFPVLLRFIPSGPIVKPALFDTLLVAFFIYLVAETWNPNQNDLL